MTFELATKIYLAIPLSVQQGRAGWKWLRNLMRLRNPQVTLAAIS